VLCYKEEAKGGSMDTYYAETTSNRTEKTEKA
jgi:hypothetical protein